MLTRAGSVVFWTASATLIVAGAASAVLAFRADANTPFILSMLVSTVGISMATALPILNTMDRRRARRADRLRGFEVIR